MKKNLFTLLIAVFSLTIFLNGCTSPQKQDTTMEKTSKTSTDSSANNNSKDTMTEVKKYSMAEISKHNGKDDCWLLIAGKVYDVSEYATHPGGEAILEGCGKDATSLFETRPMGSKTPHSDKARGYMAKFEIGEIEAGS